MIALAHTARMPPQMGKRKTTTKKKPPAKRKLKFNRLQPPKLDEREKHSWENWTDGGLYVLRRPYDFTCTTEAFRTGAYDYARSRKLKVWVSVRNKTTIELQFGGDRKGRYYKKGPPKSSSSKPKKPAPKKRSHKYFPNHGPSYEPSEALMDFTIAIKTAFYKRNWSESERLFRKQ
jgi:hypothetical protein